MSENLLPKNYWGKCSATGLTFLLRTKKLIGTLSEASIRSSFPSNRTTKTPCQCQHQVVHAKKHTICQLARCPNKHLNNHVHSNPHQVTLTSAPISSQPEQWQKRAKEAQWKPPSPRGHPDHPSSCRNGMVLVCSVSANHSCISLVYSFWFIRIQFNPANLAKAAGRREVSTLLRKWHVATPLKHVLSPFCERSLPFQTFQIFSDDFPKQAPGHIQSTSQSRRG